MIVGPITHGHHQTNRTQGNARRRQWLRTYRRTLLAADGLAALLAGLLIHSQHRHWALVLGLPPAWLFAMGAYRAYDADTLGAGPEEFRRVLRGAVALPAVAVSWYWLVLRDDDFLHSMMVAAVPVALVAVGVRVVLRRRLLRRFAAERRHRAAVVVGSAEGLLELLPRLGGTPTSALRVAGLCLTDPEQAGSLGSWAEHVWGGLHELPSALHDTDSGAVVVVPTPQIGAADMRRLSWSAAAAGADFLVAPLLTDVAASRLSVRVADGMALIGVRAPELGRGARFPKELLERSLAAVMLLALAPLMLAVSLVVRVDSAGPALFRQRRVGQYGNHFTMFKFRTMHTDAEQRRAKLEQLNQNSDGLLFKIKADPRITRVGSALRRYSIDELPQLINVVAGHMSLVGPRPSLPAEADGYTNEIRRRLLVKPGLTGLWQVSGRSDLPWEEAVRLDLAYVDNWSLALDADILRRTGPAVVRGTGAY
ncbi:exopolysaccharide biosynthesis polyprenyl glycosylphosphotransferase [Streptacidiphilus melanogenes]|uniref:exopolysaccharide biosynthesis polyprenyl glycosylphosphotransferase n=1 Tax=Streptacidiphilus melanogenes TaxID=411235 RepID=UPI0007C7B8BE|nr:exopolysaccharide biosynthesis polyprenyl glycosylphosphotransferase [Streptacidiphilus melanogenes]